MAAGAGLISLDEVKAFLNITSTTNDEELREFVAACKPCRREVRATQVGARGVHRDARWRRAASGAASPSSHLTDRHFEGGTSLSAGEYRLKFHGGAVGVSAVSRPHTSRAVWTTSASRMWLASPVTT